MNYLITSRSSRLLSLSVDNDRYSIVIKQRNAMDELWNEKNIKIENCKLNFYRVRIFVYCVQMPRDTK